MTNIISTSGICYQLTRKKIKNINLRIQKDGAVCVSAPHQIPISQIDAFVDSKSAWIASAKIKQARRQAQDLLPFRYSKQQALDIFLQIDKIVYQIFQDHLSQHPKLIVKPLKASWGICHPSKNTITLNQRLCEYPNRVILYVIVHEYSHFIHPNHSKAFWQVVESILPDWRVLRNMLKAPAAQ